MPQYLSPGVYVEEVPSGASPIAGVGTSTAGFIGVAVAATVEPAPVNLRGRQLARALALGGQRFPAGTQVTDANVDAIIQGVGPGNMVQVVGPLRPVRTHLLGMTLQEDVTGGEETFSAGTVVTDANLDAITAGVGAGNVAAVSGPLRPVRLHLLGMTLLEDVNLGGQAIEAGTLITDANMETILAAIGDQRSVQVEPPAPENVPQLITNFSQFTRLIGGFSATNAQQNLLAHGVYGFFNNGGTRCWVARVAGLDDAGAVGKALAAFAAIDEIALVAAPGALNQAVQSALLDHCENMGDRFAILDGQRAAVPTVPNIQGALRNSNYAAMYYPWIQVYDPAMNQNVFMPPSGHLAGIYARVDTLRGVHKAPANEVIRGALGVEARLGRPDQDGLNPLGINVIRQFDGNVTVWGARTLGGDANGEWKYINVRRLFLFLRESIDQGTQWVVFEPNAPDLWAKITRNVVAFLTTVWRDGALFGASPAEAFFVKCDAETNPPEVRDLGQVITEIGVAVVKPAEFVIFRISQWAGPSA